MEPLVGIEPETYSLRIALAFLSVLLMNQLLAICVLQRFLPSLPSEYLFAFGVQCWDSNRVLLEKTNVMFYHALPITLSIKPDGAVFSAKFIEGRTTGL